MPRSLGACSEARPWAGHFLREPGSDKHSRHTRTAPTDPSVRALGARVPGGLTTPAPTPPIARAGDSSLVAGVGRTRRATRRGCLRRSIGSTRASLCTHAPRPPTLTSPLYSPLAMGRLKKYQRPDIGNFR